MRLVARWRRLRLALRQVRLEFVRTARTRWRRARAGPAADTRAYRRGTRLLRRRPLHLLLRQSLLQLQLPLLLQSLLRLHLHRHPLLHRLRRLVRLLLLPRRLLLRVADLGWFG